MCPLQCLTDDDGNCGCLQSPVALGWDPVALLHQVEQLLEVADLDIQDKALEALHNLLAADASLVPVCKAGSLQRRLEAMEAQEGDQVCAPRLEAVVKVVTPAEAAGRVMRRPGKWVTVGCRLCLWWLCARLTVSNDSWRQWRLRTVASQGRGVVCCAPVPIAELFRSGPAPVCGCSSSGRPWCCTLFSSAALPPSSCW